MVEVEKEITVKLRWTLDEAKFNFVNKGMRLSDSFILKDIYLVKDNIDVEKTPNLQLLSQTIILREWVGKENVKQMVTKEKKYDDKGDIITSKKYTCSVEDIELAYDSLTKVGLKECFRYEQECLVYSNGEIEVLLQYVPELGLFAEIEDNTKSIEELIEGFKKLDIPYYENDYFVKKASLMLDVIKKQRG